LPEVITQYIAKLKERWNSFDKSQKIRISMSLLIICASIAIAAYLVARPNYEKVISGSAKEIGEMSKILADSNIAHKLGDNNTSILVESKSKDCAQIALAQSGYLNDGIKFEDSLNLISFSTTESDKKKIFKEYYESKIANQLKKMDTISEAIVNLSIPEKSVFIGDDNSDKPTASVMITPKGGLNDVQIDGIAKLVASSVERLSPNDVTIVDNTGAVLNDTDNGSTVGISNKQMQIQSQKKKEIEKQVSQLLTDMTDNVRVVANIVCDFDQEKTTSVEYNSPIEGSDSGIVRSSETSKENLQNMDDSAIPGTDANQGTGGEITSSGSNSSYKKEQNVNSYEINQTNKEVIKGLGNVDPQKSSLTVNLLYGIKFPDQPTDETVGRVAKMVSTATGINQDRITVASFKILPGEPVKTSINWMLILEKYSPYLGGAVIIIIVLIVVTSMGKKIKEDMDSPGFATVTKGAKIDFAVKDDDSIKELDNNSEVKKQIGSFIDKQPDIAAGMLRNWIYENEKNS
jgi:flagellar M-ring protein FliF